MICTQILSFFKISLQIERQYGTQHDGDSIMWPHLSGCLSLEIRSFFAKGETLDHHDHLVLHEKKKA